MGGRIGRSFFELREGRASLCMAIEKGRPFFLTEAK